MKPAAHDLGRALRELYGRRCFVCGNTSVLTHRQAGYAPLAVDYVCSVECVLAAIHRAPPNGHRRYCPAVEIEYKGPAYYSELTGLMLRSHYEVVVAEYLHKNNISFDYEPYQFLVDDGRRYVVDFHLQDKDLFIEVKGRWLGGSLAKYKAFRRRYPHIPIMVLHWMLHNEFA